MKPLFTMADVAAHSKTFFTDMPASLMHHFDAQGEPSIWERVLGSRWGMPRSLVAVADLSAWEMICRPERVAA